MSNKIISIRNLTITQINLQLQFLILLEVSWIMIIIQNPHKIDTVVGQYKVNVCINFVIGGANEGNSGSGYPNYSDRLVVSLIIFGEVIPSTK